MTSLKRAVIYTRFSSDRQNETSTEAQVRACREYAASHGFTVLNVYSDESISGKGSCTNKRDKYRAMLRDASNGKFDVILIHKYDRVARSLAEHVTLEQKLIAYNVTLIATAQDFGTGNEAKLVRSLMWSLSEYYIDNLAAETRKGHKEVALKARHNGGYAPFGYSVNENGTYSLVDYEVMWVRKMGECMLKQCGFTNLIAEMEAAGIVGRRGKPISYPQIYEILSNEKYAGTYTYCVEQEKSRTNRRTKPSAIRIENAMPAIFTKEEFEEIQKIMKSHKHIGKRANYLCSGLVYCSCGAKMHVFKSTRKGHTYLYYRCSEKCGTPGVPVHEVDASVYKYIDALLTDEVQHNILCALRDYEKNEKQAKTDFNNILKKKIEEKEKQYNSLMQNLTSGALPPAVVADIGTQMLKIKNEVETLKATKPPKEISTPHISNWLNSIKSASSDDAVKLLVDKIHIKSKNTIEVTSTLTAFLGNLGCGGPYHSLPTILFKFIYSF